MESQDVLNESMVMMFYVLLDAQMIDLEFGNLAFVAEYTP